MSEGFVHKGRVVYALYYDFTDGRACVINLHPDGGCSYATRFDGRPIVVTQVGDEINLHGEKVTVAKLKVWSSLPVKSPEGD